MNLKRLLPVIAIFSIMLFAIPAKAGEYFTLEEYIELHPAEKNWKIALRKS